AFQEVFPDQPARLLTGAQPQAPAFTALFTPGKIDQCYQYLHLATHGYFEEPIKIRDACVTVLSPLQMSHERFVYKNHPLFRSKPVLAGANADPVAGLVTAQEIAGLDLRGLDLVVLSACDTGLGVGHAGEGVQGLQQAFHLAGSRTLVASLWSIDDGATALL